MMQLAMQQAMLDAFLSIQKAMGRPGETVGAGQCKTMLGACIKHAWLMHKVCINHACSMQPRCLYLRKYACGMPARGGRTYGRTYERTPPPWASFLTFGNARNAKPEIEEEFAIRGVK